MLKYCPNCQDETEIKHNICTECGEELFEEKKVVKNDEWEDEDEHTESDWGQDIDEDYVVKRRRIEIAMERGEE